MGILISSIPLPQLGFFQDLVVTSNSKRFELLLFIAKKQ